MSSSPLKSTIVRSKNHGTRLAFRIGELLAPRVTGRAACRLWFTLPPPMPAIPLPPGGEAFTVTAQGHAVRGHVWGEGPVVYLVHGWGGLAGQLGAFVGPLTDAGFRVVAFDGPAHGASDPGPSGPGHSHGAELGRALDAVAARFGPAHSVVAHSLGAIATYLTLEHGWLGTDRLVLVAPMVDGVPLFDAFQRAVGFGPRTRRAFDREVKRFVGFSAEEFDARLLGRQVDPVPTLVVHDRRDRQTAYAEAQDLVTSLPDARLVTTDGLGHRRILADPGVVRTVVAFIRADRDGLRGVA